ncbi:hypothetical protein [Lacimicrobium alkaliphilum]|nr:hypothetical protein [Lacimicrobium alkaliphilum]
MKTQHVTDDFECVLEAIFNNYIDPGPAIKKRSNGAIFLDITDTNILGEQTKFRLEQETANSGKVRMSSVYEGDPRISYELSIDNTGRITPISGDWAGLLARLQIYNS